LVFKFLIQAIHQVDIYKYQNDKNVYGALLGKPKAELEPSHLNLIKCVYQQNSETKRNSKPYGQKDNQILQIGFPIGVFVIHCFDLVRQIYK
jgi:hypothetical protein